MRVCTRLAERCANGGAVRHRVLDVRFGSTIRSFIAFRPRRSVCGCLVVGLLALVIAACGGEDDEAAEPDSAPSGAGTASATPKLVGRWERVQTCRELAHALSQADLSALAPAVLTDFFPGTSARELARKANACKGATPRAHAHFFTKDGAFGSLDENGSQVDEDSYRIVDDDTLQIGDGRFDYRILHGDTLILRPVITGGARRRALAHPREFSTAGWQVAVSYDGLPWKRVSCEGWC